MEIAIIARAKQGFIYRYMIENSITVVELAKRVGISATKMGNIINFKWIPNENSYQSRQIVKSLEDFFHIPIEVLFPPELTKEIAKKLSIKRAIIEDIELVSLDCASGVAMIEYDEDGESSIIDAALSDYKMLTPRQQYVIQEWNLSDNPKTLDEIAKELGVTRERVRQIHAVAIKKIQWRAKQFWDADVYEYAKNKYYKPMRHGRTRRTNDGLDSE